MRNQSIIFGISDMGTQVSLIGVDILYQTYKGMMSIIGDETTPAQLGGGDPMHLYGVTGGDDGIEKRPDYYMSNIRHTQEDRSFEKAVGRVSGVG